MYFDCGLQNRKYISVRCEIPMYLAGVAGKACKVHWYRCAKPMYFDCGLQIESTLVSAVRYQLYLLVLLHGCKVH